MKTYNHGFDLGFSIGGSTTPDGEDLTAAQLREGLQKRINSLSDDELLEALGAPFDSYEEMKAPGEHHG